MRVMISGGGTGGHIFPALSIATGIRDKYPDADIHFVGASGKMEMDKVPRAGFPITGVPIRGIQRRWTWKNLAVPHRLVISLWKCYQLLKRFRPQIVIGVGGYASAPLLWVASKMNIPIVIQEQNSYPGLTNRWLAGAADKIFVAFPHMDRYFPKERIVFTGNPIRKELKESQLEKQESLRFFDLGLNSTLLIFGGSLGAKTLNDAVMASAPLLRKHSDIQLLWQCGPTHYELCKASDVAQLPQVVLLPFIDKMERAYAAADLVICRAGALTISELSAMQKAAVLVPSPNVADDHQTKNAMTLVERDAALLIKDKDGLLAVEQAIQLVRHPQKLESMRKNIAPLGRLNAVETIIHEIETLLI